MKILVDDPIEGSVAEADLRVVRGEQPTEIARLLNEKESNRDTATAGI